MSADAYAMALPPGVRSTDDGPGGRWTHCRVDGQVHLRAELDAALAGSSRSHDQMLRAELEALMERAERGKLRYGNRAQVEHMGCTRAILEIRLQTHPKPRKDMHVRLYYTEPAHMDGVLLSAMLASKYPGKPGVTQQTRQAKAAQRRADQHVRSIT